MARKKTEPGFEDLLEETEDLVEALEAGELSLDESLAGYEKGIRNLRACAKMLRAAEERVQVLVEETEEVFRLDDLDEEAAGDEAADADEEEDEA
jgi:exodeoxyribonuclease VII small subunit